jgi:peptidoglycan/LPS O-acetylase OafA/YrhL
VGHAVRIAFGQAEGVPVLNAGWLGGIGADRRPLRSTINPDTRIASLDGLRAVAVALVLGFHVQRDWVPGGFAGVDIFFVLSGFLITTILLAEIAEHGRINYRAFFVRRALRLMPALWLMVGATMAISFLLFPTAVHQIAADALWVLTYTSNWQRSFIEIFGDSLIYNHTWSLGIEEQFYLTWPLALSFVAARLNRRQLLACTLVSVVAVSCWRIALLADGNSAFRIYHGFDTRADQLLIGCSLAIAMTVSACRATLAALLRRVPSLSLVLIASLPMIGWLWPFGTTGMLVAGFTLNGLFAAIVIADCVLCPLHPLPRLLSLTPIIYIGRISYGIYLWHVPLIVFSYRLGLGDGARGTLWVVIMSLLMAALSYHLLERRVLALRPRTQYRVQASQAGGAASDL